MNKLSTTLNRIKAHQPCVDGYKKLVKYIKKHRPITQWTQPLDYDAPVTYETIVKSNGLDDALWAMQCEPQYNKQWITFAVKSARQVQHLMKDQRSIDALDHVQQWLDGEIDSIDFSIIDAAQDAWRDCITDCDASKADVAAARCAVAAAASKAAVAAAASKADVAAAASKAAYDAAAYAAAYAAAQDAAYAARDAAYAAARDAQTELFLEIVNG